MCFEHTLSVRFELSRGQDPKRYIEAAKAEKGRKYLKSIKEYDAGTYERIVKGDTEALQDFLRARKQASARAGIEGRLWPLCL